jgi:hypothetical protein
MGVWTCGAFAGDELEVEAHGGEGQQEVGEDDGGVDAEALGGGDGDFGGDVGVRQMSSREWCLRTAMYSGM